jgi:hypothetical protein
MNGREKGSKLMLSLYAAFYGGSMAQLCFIKLNGKNPVYTKAIAEAEGVSERAAALALKRNVSSTHWAREGIL